MFAVLRHRSFGLLLGGHVISGIGDLVLFVALPFWVYQLTGSVAATGAMFMALTLPRLVFSPLAGVFVDRWDRKTTMVLSDLLRAGIVLGFLLVRSADHAWIIYLLACAESTVSQFFIPARAAALPAIVRGADLPRANAALGMCDALAQLVGPALGGVLVAGWGPHGAAAFDAVSYLLSAAAIALARIPTLERRPPPAGGTRVALRAVARELAEGVHVVAQRPVLRGVFGVGALLMLAQGVINALLVVVVSRIWGGGARELGWLVSAQGIGALLGGGLLGGPAARAQPRTLMLIGGTGAGLLLALMVNQPSIHVAMALVMLVGGLVVGLFIGEQTLLQRASDDANRGRVTALLTTVTAAAMLVSSGVTSLVGGAIGVRTMMDIAALLMVLSGLTARTIPTVATQVRPADVDEPAIGTSHDQPRPASVP